MSDTPRTDAAVIQNKKILTEVGLLDIVDAGTARQLERELSEARAECERLREDAERLDWLSKNYGYVMLSDPLRQMHDPTGTGNLRAAIDAARKP